MAKAVTDIDGETAPKPYDSARSSRSDRPTSPEFLMSTIKELHQTARYQRRHDRPLVQQHEVIAMHHRFRRIVAQDLRDLIRSLAANLLQRLMVEIHQPPRHLAPVGIT